MRPFYPSKYVTKRKLERKGIDLDTDSRVLDVAGPYPNITGMRKQKWGIGAYILKHGTYAYKVEWSLYELF